MTSCATILLLLAILGQDQPQRVGKPISQPFPVRKLGEPLPVQSFDPKSVDDRSTDNRRASDRYRAPGTPTRLKQIDGPFADRDALSTSLRHSHYDASASPIGFQHSYRIEGMPDRVIRASGGLYAIAPYSHYKRTKKGPMPTIAPATIFSIGMPIEWMLEAQGIAPAGAQQRGPAPGTSINRRLEGRAENPPIEHSGDASRAAAGRQRATTDARPPLKIASALPPIVESEGYRREFYRSLLMR